MLDELIEIFATQLGYDVDDIGDDISYDKIKNVIINELIKEYDIDSLDLIQLIINIEDHYSIEITDNEIEKIIDMTIDNFLIFLDEKRMI